MFDAIFWDNDGVLMDTERLYFCANVEALARVGIDLTLETFRDVSLRRGQSVLKPVLSGEHELRQWRDARYLDLLAQQARVIPGVHETLKMLKGHVPMAIVTGCRRVHFMQMHRRSGILPYFDFFLTREDYINAKPDPEPYLKACARAGFSPENCLAVEDSQRGVISAASAGLRTAVIPGALDRDGDFRAAHLLLDSVTQIPALFGLSLHDGQRPASK